jgi:TnpA family transposase
MLLSVLSVQEQKRFDYPQKMNADFRQKCFSLRPDVERAINRLRTPTNKVGFMLQFGHFIATQRFYLSDRFDKNDVNYVIKLLAIDKSKVDLSAYKKKIPADHQKKILKLSKCYAFDALAATGKVKKYISNIISEHVSPKIIFVRTLAWLHDEKIEIPSYNTLAEYITEGFREFESKLVNRTNRLLKKLDKIRLDQLLESTDNKPSIFNRLKYINQSTRPKAIQAGLEVFFQLQDLFLDLEPVISKLNLLRNTRLYYANWMQKAKLSQVKQFAQSGKKYFHLLLFLENQFYIHQDSLVDMLLKCVQSEKSRAKRNLKEIENLLRPKQKESIVLLREVRHDDKQFKVSIESILANKALSSEGKLTAIHELLIDYSEKYDESKTAEIDSSDDALNELDKDAQYYQILENGSVKLQNKVSRILQALMFDCDSPNESLTRAVDHFNNKSGDISASAPRSFIPEGEREILNKKNNKFRPSLYKSLFFIAVCDGIKSGNLNLKYSHRYKAINEYLISYSEWDKHKKRLLEEANISHLSNVNHVISDLKSRLDTSYFHVNARVNTNQNPYLSIDSSGKVSVRTPPVSDTQEKHITTLLEQVNYVPLLQILSDVNDITNFTNCFEHYGIKHTKGKPSPATFIAGIIAQGCNIGVEKLAHTSKGVLENTLKNTVQWYFSHKNINSANNEVIAMIQKLSLPNVFINKEDENHTSSDGRKVGVAVESLVANYSFKYFGKDKGVSVYTFIDEKQSLFYSNVFSASEREAAYVIDGLINNDVIKSSIHSTDTHGYTETIFGASHFLSTAYAPRIKNIKKQKLYAFSAKKTYENKGYKILPSRPINVSVIKDNWDDILRFMATILLKRETASQLFKRLSSYAKENPLYKALKEFGRIIKSLFILQYYDDVQLRQRIEKQLNRIELSNRFGRAIFFDNSAEFQKPNPEEQSLITDCQVLIQNAIVLWNYLYLSQLLTDLTDKAEREALVELISTGSVLCWHHVNLLGTFDFTQISSNDSAFNIEKILALEVV